MVTLVNAMCWHHDPDLYTFKQLGVIVVSMTALVIGSHGFGVRFSCRSSHCFCPAVGDATALSSPLVLVLLLGTPSML